MKSYIKQGNCLDLMKKIPTNSINMILCDLPYGTTNCKWDIVIDFDKLWSEYNRIIKDNGAIVLFGSQPFTAELIHSNLKGFKYEWIWEKQKSSNFMGARFQPLKFHENILVFGKKGQRVNYYPIKYEVLEKKDINDAYISKGINAIVDMINSGVIRNFGKKDRRVNVNNPNINKEFMGNVVKRVRYEDDGFRYPKSIIYCKKSINKNVHPTQKPVALCEYLIKTYTKENEVVLDNCMGSGTTCVACINTSRNYIGFELEDKYFKIAEERIEKAKTNKQEKLF